MGATHFQMRTLPKVATEMAFSVLAYNMKRVMTLVGVAALIAAARAYGTGAAEHGRSERLQCASGGRRASLQWIGGRSGEKRSREECFRETVGFSHGLDKLRPKAPARSCFRRLLPTRLLRGDAGLS